MLLIITENSQFSNEFKLPMFPLPNLVPKIQTTLIIITDPFIEIFLYLTVYKIEEIAFRLWCVLLVLINLNIFTAISLLFSK